MQELATGWMVDTERGPDCLFVQLQSPEQQLAEGNDLADSLWSLLQQHFTYRLVLELNELSELRSSTIGQLVLLHKRIHKHGGLLRMCGLSDECQQSLRACCLESLLPHYRDREEALMGFRPTQPK